MSTSTKLKRQRIEEANKRILGEDSKPGPGDYGSVSISLQQDEVDFLDEEDVPFDYSLDGNELWVKEGDKKEAQEHLGIEPEELGESKTK